MEIIAASLLDLNVLRHLEKVCFPDDAWPLLDLIAVLSFPGVIRLKAVENGEMVGFVAGDLRQSAGFAWVATLAVLPDFRGRGIGRALLEACEKQLSICRVRLCVRETNAEAQRMYLNAGYAPVDQWLNYYSDGETAIIMEKKQIYG